MDRNEINEGMRRRILATADRFFTWLERKIQWTYWLYVVLVFLFVYEVISRYLFSSPHDWFLGVSITMGVWCGFLGAATTTFEDRHIALNVLYEKYPPKLQNIMDIVNSGVGFFVSGILLYYVTENAIFLYEMDSTYQTSLGLPKYVETMGAMAGLLLCMIFFLGRIVHKLK